MQMCRSFAPHCIRQACLPGPGPATGPCFGSSSSSPEIPTLHGHAGSIAESCVNAHLEEEGCGCSLDEQGQQDNSRNVEECQGCKPGIRNLVVQGHKESEGKPNSTSQPAPCQDNSFLPGQTIAKMSQDRQHQKDHQKSDHLQVSQTSAIVQANGREFACPAGIVHQHTNIHE